LSLEFGHKVPVRDASGVVTGLRDKPARRVTRNTLGGNHGPDRGRKLAVSLVDGDLIEFRPTGTRRRHVVSAFDVFAFVLRTEAAVVRRAIEKARKDRKAQRLADARQARAGG